MIMRLRFKDSEASHGTDESQVDKGRLYASEA